MSDTPESVKPLRFLAPPYFNVNVELPPNGLPGEYLVRSEEGSPYAVEWASYAPAQGEEGIQGPQGIQGPTGPQGEVGPQGPQGTTGDTGPQGIQGPQGNVGPQGPIGLTGATGATGPAGAAGVGLPSGGTAGQVLAKVDGTDFNTEWVDQTGGGGGGATPVGAHRFWGIRNASASGNDLSIATLAFRNAPTGSPVTTATAFATSSFDESTLPANAFDTNTATIWAGAAGDRNATIWGDFGTAITFNELSITSRSGVFSSQTPTSFTIVYSDDGVKFFDLIDVSYPTLFGSNETRMVSLPVTQSSSVTGGAAFVTQRTSGFVRPNGTTDTGVAVGFVTAGLYHIMTGQNQGGFPVADNGGTTVNIDECYARPLKIVVPTRITQAKIFVNGTSAGTTSSYRIYTNSVNGRPDTPVTDRLNFSLSTTGEVTVTLASPVTLAAGIYWIVQTSTSSTASLRTVRGGGPIVIYNGGFIWTGLFSANTGNARLNSTNLAAQTWSTDTGPDNISSTRDTVFFDFNAT